MLKEGKTESQKESQKVSQKERKNNGKKDVYSKENCTELKGDVKINWLQPPYSAASCSQLILKMPYINCECCNISAAASSYEF